MKQSARYWFGRKSPLYGDVLKLRYPNASCIYITTKQGVRITVPKRLCKKQLADKKRKYLEIAISPAELKALFEVMQKVNFLGGKR